MKLAWAAAAKALGGEGQHLKEEAPGEVLETSWLLRAWLSGDQGSPFPDSGTAPHPATGCLALAHERPHGVREGSAPHRYGWRSVGA